MTAQEFSDQFDVLYNNITSNQAPGLTEYEKSVFLTKAQNEIVKNYFTANSKGNNIGQGFDDSAKRQADFSCLMMTKESAEQSGTPIGYKAIDSRSSLFLMPDDIFIVINESIVLSNPKDRVLQVIPLRYDEYMRLMSKPFKRPLKYQAWRLINNGAYNGVSTNRYAEIIIGPNQTLSTYTVRYIKFPKPIIVGDLDGLTINNYEFGDSGDVERETIAIYNCDTDPSIYNLDQPADLPEGQNTFRLNGNTFDESSNYVLEYTGGTNTTFSYGVVNYNGIEYEWVTQPSSGTLSQILNEQRSLTGNRFLLVWVPNKMNDTNTIILYKITSSSSSSNTGTRKTTGCELDPILHEDILQRAIELAKVAWTSTGQDNAQMIIQAGERSE